MSSKSAVSSGAMVAMEPLPLLGCGCQMRGRIWPSSSRTSCTPRNSIGWIRTWLLLRVRHSQDPSGVYDATRPGLPHAPVRSTSARMIRASLAIRRAQAARRVAREQLAVPADDAGVRLRAPATIRGRRRYAWPAGSLQIRASCAGATIAQLVANGGVQRRRVLHCGDFVGTRHRPSSTRNAARTSAPRVACVSRLRHQLPDDRRRWLGHSALTDRLARRRLAAPAHQPAAAARHRLPTVPDEPHRPRNPRHERRAGVRHGLFGLTLLSIRLLGFALDGYARRAHLYSTEHADEELQTNRRTSVPVVISYVVAILVGLALPTLAVVLYFALAVLIVVPFSEVRRLVFKRSQP